MEAIGSAQQSQLFDLWAYVFMPEHIHLLVWPQEGVQISGILKAIKQPVAVVAVRYVKTCAPEFLEQMKDLQPNGRYTHRFWQRGGGYDRNLWTIQAIHEKIQYIHANPVRRGLVASACDWLWSSWQAWENGVDSPLRIDRESLPPLGNVAL